MSRNVFRTNRAYESHGLDGLRLRRYMAREIYRDITAVRGSSPPIVSPLGIYRGTKLAIVYRAAVVLNAVIAWPPALSDMP